VHCAVIVQVVNVDCTYKLYII